MKTLNKVFLIGNLGKDPEIKTFASNGSKMAYASLATQSGIFDKESDSYKDQTEWHKVVFYGNLAKVVERYLKKGSKIFVEGTLRTRKWQDKNNQDRYTTEVVVREIQMLDSKKAGDEINDQDDLFADLSMEN